MPDIYGNFAVKKFPNQNTLQWRDTAAMKTALAQGVGLVPPPNMDEGDAAFWITLANATSAMQPRDKVGELSLVVMKRVVRN